MKLFKLNQTGAGHLIALFVIVFVGVVSFAGYKVATMNQVEDNPPVTANVGEGVPAAIATPADLDKTSAALDSDSELAANLNDEKLDDDLEAML